MKVKFSDAPETLRQAKRWDEVKVHYQRKGLCGSCAAQAAWGSQIGFSRIMPPCDDCFPIVVRFPGKGAGDWRSDPLIHSRDITRQVGVLNPAKAPKNP
jgi:hypothetical protein